MNYQVEKATAIARIQTDLERLPQVRSACVAIVNFLSSGEHNHIQRVTFGQLSRIAGLAEIADILPAVEYLSGGRLHLLDPRFEFIDVENDLVEEVSRDEVARARQGAVFYHPHTGEPVANFEKSLFMFFVLSDDALSLGHGT